MSDDNFLSRWSRRKIESKTAAKPLEEAPAATSPPVEANSQAVAAEPPPPEPLPPIESLTPDSDFTPFMKAEVDPGLKRQAFKKLIEDPQFNVMDGLDVYIDDYSKPDPLPEGWLEKMNQVKHLGIFKVPEEEALGEPDGQPEPPQKPAAEQPLAVAAPQPSPDTSGEEVPPAEVGKSGAFRGGI